MSVEKTSGTFRMGCTVRKTIHASPDQIWALLTDADAFPRWNSTVTSIEGRIAEGQTLKVKVPYAATRTFKLKVSGVAPARRMVWSDGMAPMFRGVRTFVLEPNSDGTTNFSMHEAFSGLMLPLIKGSLPDFGPLFETYAEDLRRAAEGASR
jgi:hypothetical protein